MQANTELLSAACCIAAADQKITEGEMKLLRRLAEQVGVSEITVNATVDRARRDPGFYQQQFSLGIGNARAMIKTLLMIAAADGRISTDERTLICHFADKLGLPRGDFDEILSELIGKVRAKRRLRGEEPA